MTGVQTCALPIFPPDQRTVLAQRAELGFVTKYYKIMIGEIPMNTVENSSMQRVYDALLNYKNTGVS